MNSGKSSLGFGSAGDTDDSKPAEVKSKRKRL